MNRTRPHAPYFSRSWAALGVLLLAAAIPCGCRQGGAAEDESVEEAAEPPRVSVVSLQLQNWPRVANIQGSLLADEYSVVGAKVAGRVKQVNVDLGSVVRKSEVLVMLEFEEFDFRVKQAEAQLEQARAKLGLKPDQLEDKVDPLQVPSVVQHKALRDEAKNEYTRAKVLVAGKAIATEEVQQREAALAVAEAKYQAALDEVNELIAIIGTRRAELGLARQSRTDATICAPFDGVVQQRHVAPGSYLDVGDQVVTLVRTDPLRFHGGIPEREVPYVRLRQDASIRIEGEPAPLLGQVTRLCPVLDTSSRALIVEVDLPNPQSRLRSGLFAQAEIVVDPAARTLAVPVGAVREFAGIEKVWVVRNGEAAEQPIQTGRRSAERIEILEGLSVGDLVVLDYRQARAGRVSVELTGAGGRGTAEGSRNAESDTGKAKGTTKETHGDDGKTTGKVSAGSSDQKVRGIRLAARGIFRRPPLVGTVRDSHGFPPSLLPLPPSA